MTSTLLWVYTYPLRNAVRDNYTLRRGLLHHYFVMGIPQPQIDNVQKVHVFSMEYNYLYSLY